jgi:nucleoredoxin
MKDLYRTASLTGEGRSSSYTPAKTPEQADPALTINPECRRNEKANLAATVLGAPADEDWGVMKAVILPIVAVSLAATAMAEFRTWTRNDGKTAEQELISVAVSADEKVGQFKMQDGRTVSLNASTLSEADAKILADWKPASDPVAVGSSSIFDDILDGKLVKLNGKSLKSLKDFQKPAKFYVFYYTASWCGPCHQFTPSLVEFYKENKNENFEIVLITSDKEENAMEEYATEKEMPWPQLKLDKVDDFKKDFKHGVTGIPSVIVCDLEGKNLGNFRSDLNKLAELVK